MKNIRKRTIITTVLISISLIAVVVAGNLVTDSMLTTNFLERNLPPSLGHIFGTDWLGRDMFLRTLKGMVISIGIGLLASAVSAVVALILGVMSATMGRHVDAVITWIIDLFLAIPHLLIIILICFAVGGGIKGVIIGVSLTHWPSLARIIRGEVMQVRSSTYCDISRQMGKSNLYVGVHHIFPHVLPQLIIGTILLFPHAILHEAAVTFLGFGLPPHEPAIGIILSEAMKYLPIGSWWLAFFPGLVLLGVVLGFDVLGENIRKLTDPRAKG